MKKSFYSSDFKLGILGGGQLGRMLIQESINYDIHIEILDPDKNAPCKDICAQFINGNLQDFDTVYNFGKNMDVVTIEIEHVNVEALHKLKAEGVTVYPQPEVLEIIQDKGLQKDFFTKNNIATAPYVLIKDKNEIEQHLDKMPFMQKLRKGGYDGRGVTPIKSDKDIETAFDAPSVLENFIDFEKEISVIVGRNPQGEISCFPVVELVFNPEANLVEYLFSPAVISTEVEQKALQLANKIAKDLNIVGIMAVEMFVDKSGEVFVNEIAPRPHNSGHHTIEANETSQYLQHLKAILGLPLGSTESNCHAAMINLLGEKGYEGEVYYKGLEETLQKGVFPHIYGKKITKPFRKMGHITVVGKDADTVKSQVNHIKNNLKVISK